MKRFVQAGLVLVLALASGVAAALGLGQIELRSKLGEPLLAEIPIISNDPGELRRLRVGLAPPETFARVGLEPPDETVANLRFVSALDARGNPVIRVTSAQPITQPLLTFLIEVDWGQGQLVREYSTLLAAPRTVAAPIQPSIQAPVAAPSNAIVRPPAAAAPAPQPEPKPVAAAPQPGPKPVAAAPVQPRAADAIAATAAPPTPATTSPDPPPPRRGPEQYAEVERGDTLSEIATRLDLQVSLQQAMIALLRANPDAFIDGNINRLMQGAILRVPPRTELQALDAAQASALVRTQTREWRRWRQASAAVPQPAVAQAIGDANAADSPSPTDAAATPAGARLEIVPPGASEASEAGTQSGVAAGGEGDMQRQQLMATRETLAARNAELADLKSRVAELEQIQAQQQKLLSMKDSELAAVQQRLAQTGEAAPSEPQAAVSALPWVLGGAGLLLLALLAGWLLRRRGNAPTDARLRFRPQAASPSLADAFGPAPGRPDRAGSASASADEPSVPPQDIGRPPAPAEQAASARTPAWHAAAPAAPAASASVTDTETRSPGAEAATADAPAQEQLELARAYLDLGDRDSARQLLQEVAGDGDDGARRQASQMLRELD